MKKILLQFSMIALLAVASVAFVLLFFESQSFILGLLGKAALGIVIFASIRAIDKLYSILRNPE